MGWLRGAAGRSGAGGCSAGRAGRPVRAGRETSQQQQRSAGQASEEPAGEDAADTGPRARGDGESSTTTSQCRTSGFSTEKDQAERNGGKRE